MGGFIRKTLAQRGIRARAAAVAVSREQAIFHVFRLPDAPDDELIAMAQFQMAKELPYPAEEARIDVTFVSHPKGKKESTEGRSSASATATGGQTAAAAGSSEPQETVTVLAVAVRSPVIDYLQKVVKSAKLKLVQIGLRAYANFCLVGRCINISEHGRILFVDVGPDFTEIDIFDEQNLLFSRSSFVKIPEDVRRPLLHSEKEARKNNSKLSPQRTEDIVEELELEIHRSVQAYHAAHGGGAFALTLIGGGTGLEKDLAERLSQRLEIPAEIMYPGKTFRLPKNINGDERMYSACLGLALGPGRPEIIGPLDFLNPRRPKIKRVTSSTRQKVMRYVAAALFLIGGIVIAARMAMSVHRQEADRAVRYKNKVKEEYRNYLLLKRRVKEVDNWIEQGGYHLSELKRITELLPPTDEAYASIVEIKAGGRIEIKGRARSSVTPDEITEKLTSVGHYKVEPGSTSPISDRYGFNQSFALTLQKVKSNPSGNDEKK
jgi:Tfp pilus assembly PilM family ATPase